jgi:hypothetical protein
MKRTVEDFFDGLGIAVAVMVTVLAIVRLVRGSSVDVAAGMFLGMLGIPLLYVLVCRILDQRRTRYRDEGPEGR